MKSLEEIREFFAKDLYATETTGVVIDEVGDRYAKCSLQLSAKHKNARGHLMGGVIFTLADFVFAVATNAQGQDTVTVVGEVTYFSSAKGDVLYGESKLLKDGKRNCYYDIWITDNLGTNVARVAMTGMHLDG